MSFVSNKRKLFHLEEHPWNLKRKTIPVTAIWLLALFHSFEVWCGLKIKHVWSVMLDEIEQEATFHIEHNYPQSNFSKYLLCFFGIESESLKKHYIFGWILCRRLQNSKLEANIHKISCKSSSWKLNFRSPWTLL